MVKRMHLDNSVIDMSFYLDNELAKHPMSVFSVTSSTSKFTLEDILNDLQAVKTLYIEAPSPQWVISPKTYETIKYLANFREPIRKLRKVQLRRIAQRKKLYRAHRARVNNAIKQRVLLTAQKGNNP